MANAMPGAIGVQLAFPDRQVVTFSGDGGLSTDARRSIVAPSAQATVNSSRFQQQRAGVWLNWKCWQPGFQVRGLSW